MTVERLDGLSNFEALGMMVAICVQSDSYMSWSIEDLSRYFMPPITLNQYAVFANEGQLAGFMTWAFLSDSATAALRDRHEEPGVDDWQSGHQLWFMDMVAKPGQTPAMSRMMREHILRNANSRHAFALRRTADGSVRKVSWFPVLHDAATAAAAGAP